MIKATIKNLLEAAKNNLKKKEKQLFKLELKTFEINKNLEADIDATDAHLLDALILIVKTELKTFIQHFKDEIKQLEKMLLLKDETKAKNAIAYLIINSQKYRIKIINDSLSENKILLSEMVNFYKTKKTAKKILNDKPIKQLKIEIENQEKVVQELKQQLTMMEKIETQATEAKAYIKGLKQDLEKEKKKNKS